jgi:hypothetical protein
MKGLTASEATKRAMVEVLRRRGIEDGVLERPREAEGEEDGDEEKETSSSSESEGERCALSEASLERLRLGCELEWASLNDEERASFERACARGELVEPWVAWWESDEAGRVRVSARGGKAVEAVGENDMDAAMAHLPALAGEDELLVPFETLSQGKAAPEVLRWHCVNALAAYTLVKRAFDGEWSEDEEVATDMILQLSIVTSSKGSIAEVQCASSAIHDVVHKAGAFSPVTASFPPLRVLSITILSDLVHIFTKGSSALVRAFLDLSRAFNTARERENKRSTDARAARLSAARKCRYFAAYLASPTTAKDDIIDDIARTLRELLADHTSHPP